MEQSEKSLSVPPNKYLMNDESCSYLHGCCISGCLCVGLCMSFNSSRCKACCTYDKPVSISRVGRYRHNTIQLIISWNNCKQTNLTLSVSPDSIIFLQENIGDFKWYSLLKQYINIIIFKNIRHYKAKRYSCSCPRREGMEGGRGIALVILN
jgi:hypothetical protein